MQAIIRNPLIITPRLMVGARIGDGYISIGYSDRPGDGGRTRYHYAIDEDEGDAWIFMETVEAASPVEAIHVARETARASGGAGGKVADAVVIEGSHQCLNPLPKGTDYGDTWPLDT